MSRVTRVVHALGASIVTTLALAGAPTAPVGAQDDADQIQDDDQIQLALLDQRFTIEADGTLRFVYRVDGDLELFRLDEATAPIDDTTDDAVTDNAPADDPGMDGAAPPPPPPPALTIEVTNYAPLSALGRVAPQQLVGPDIPERIYEQLGNGGTAIDGVQLVDVRGDFDVADDGTTTLTVEVPTDVGESVAERLKLDRVGLHPIRVQLKIGEPGVGVELASHGTIVEWVDEGSQGEAIDLTVMAAIPEPPRAGPPPTDGFVAAAALSNALTTPITLEVAPRTAAAATLTLDSAARDELLVGDEVVATSARILDVSSAVAVGRSDVLARELSIGERLVVDALPAARVGRTAWIALDPLSAAGALELRNLGFRYLVMTEDMYETTVGGPLPESDRFVDVSLPDGDVMPLIVVDPIAEALTTPGTDQILATLTAFEWAVGTASTMLLEPAPGSMERSRILSSPTLAAPDPRLLVALEDLSTDIGRLRFTEGSTIPATTDTQPVPGGDASVTLPVEAGPSLVERVAILDAVALEILSTASMLPDDDERPAQWSVLIDELLTTAYDDDVALERVDELRAELDELRGAVVPPEPFTFTLTGRTGDIELQLANRGDEPLDVVLELTSSKLEFPDGDQTVTLRPNGETNVIVPVRALANGTSSVDITVSTPGGEVLADDITLTSRVTAFTGLAQVLTGGLIVILITWWIANWRSKKRRAAVDQRRDHHPSARRPDSLPTP
ncbi:MAG: hypothetical protein HRT86_14025 [Ilumatobacteraceae bacterium]|nr:hypothetical protein [Ilumatobacteraceae bacterium]